MALVDTSSWTEKQEEQSYREGIALWLCINNKLGPRIYLRIGFTVETFPIDTLSTGICPELIWKLWPLARLCQSIDKRLPPESAI